MGHKLIRRVSVDNFYAIICGQEDAFFQLCMALPSIIEKVANESYSTTVPHDTVLRELEKNAARLHITDTQFSMIMASFLLGFSTYTGFPSK